MQNNDIYVLVIIPEQYEANQVLSQKICGRTIQDYVKTEVSAFHNKFIKANSQKDILSLFRENLTSAKYTVIIYADMPLLTSQSIIEAATYCESKNAYAVRLPRGYVFDTEYISKNDNFEIIEFEGANKTDYLATYNQKQISDIAGIMQMRINETHMNNMVNIQSPFNTYIDASVKIEPGCIIEPNVQIQGESIIKENAKILMGSTIAFSTIGKDAQVGPYAHIRPGSHIGDNCKIGNYVEIKRSKLGNGSKAAHMTYIGDGIIGENCNIGCGVIFCNYNGKKKSTTVIGNNVFIGSNTSLIAPINIGNDAYIAAGSVITSSIPNNALAIARAKQALKENYTPK